MSKKPQPTGFNPNAGGKTFWPSYKYKADGTSRLFETEEEFKLEGKGWFESPGEAQEAAAKSKKGGNAFDRDGAIAKLVKAGYTVSEDTKDEELQEALKNLKG